MKRKDIALILIVVFISAIFSFILSGFLFSGSQIGTEKVEVVEPITAEFQQPDSKYFNSNSVDPTQLIKIGDDSNNQPFN